MTKMKTARKLQTRLYVRLVALFGYFGFTIHIPKAETPSTIPQQVSTPTARLLCMNLPEEVTDDVLSVLFQQYVLIILSGFRASYHIPDTQVYNQFRLPGRQHQMLLVHA